MRRFFMSISLPIPSSILCEKFIGALTIIYVVILAVNFVCSVAVA